VTIVFTPSGGSAINLAGADATGFFDAPQDYRISAERVVQRTNIVRGTKPAVRDRGNRAVSCSFLTARKYADHPAAAVALDAHVEAVTANSGTVVITQGASTIRTINNATVKPDGRTDGALTYVSYQITGTA
jgi:hypothetical protein